MLQDCRRVHSLCVMFGNMYFIHWYSLVFIGIHSLYFEFRCYVEIKKIISLLPNSLLEYTIPPPPVPSPRRSHRPGSARPHLTPLYLAFNLESCALVKTVRSFRRDLRWNSASIDSTSEPVISWCHYDDVINHSRMVTSSSVVEWWYHEVTTIFWFDDVLKHYGLNSRQPWGNMNWRLCSSCNYKLMLQVE